MRKIMLALQLILLPALIFAQDIISGESKEIAENTDFQYVISLSNQSAITALQFDVAIPTNAFDIKSGHSLSSRANGFAVSVGTPSTNILRVVIYSFGGGQISAGSGGILTLNLKTKTLPATYTFSISNIVAGGADGKGISLTNSNGIVKVLGSILNVSTTSIDFGRVPMGTSSTRYISIGNTGNENLVITKINTNGPFKVLNSLPVTVTPGSQSSLSIGVETTAKYDSTINITYETNDQDLYRQIQKTTAKAIVYAVNEMRMTAISGRSGYEVEVPVRINNMEAFTGFQFDITLPSQASYVAGSIQLTDRAVDQQIIANVVNGKLIVTSYSPSLKNFTGNDGVIAKFRLLLEGNGGTYPLNFSQAIIADTKSNNILSDYYNSTVGIKSPKIYVSQSSIDFGRLSILDSLSNNMTIYNYGDDTLKISAISSTLGNFKVKNANYPIKLAPYQQQIVSVEFNPDLENTYSGKLLIRSNDATSDPKEIAVAGVGYEPNSIAVQSQKNTTFKRLLTYVPINIENYNQITAVQFELTYPTGFNFKSDSCSLTDRKNDHIIFINKKTDNSIIVLIYSPGLKAFKGNEGNILNLAFDLKTNSFGTYNFSIQNVVLSDLSGNNRIQNIYNGTLQLANSTPIANAGLDQIVNENTLVTLDGSASSDADNDALTYKWTAPEGITLSSTTAAKPTFTTPEVSTDTNLTFTLVVNDGTADSPEDQVVVTVKGISTFVGFNDETNIFVYPNPTTDFIQISSVDYLSFSLCDLNGKILIYDNKNDKSIDLRKFASGIYIYRIETNDGVTLGKLIKTQ